MSYTPAPWTRDIAQIGKDTFEGKLCEAIFKYDENNTDNDTLIALVVDDDNVNLISAAPEMYELIKSLGSAFDSWFGEMDVYKNGEMKHLIEKIIKKVEGK